ncbi:MAG: hypothetical protein PHX51_00390 [Clostridia bacterium]|nr:hypothetical protein [Clostridia bacterium]
MLINLLALSGQTLIYIVVATICVLVFFRFLLYPILMIVLNASANKKIKRINNYMESAAKNGKSSQGGSQFEANKRR